MTYVLLTPSDKFNDILGSVSGDLSSSSFFGADCVSLPHAVLRDSTVSPEIVCVFDVLVEMFAGVHCP